MTKKTTSLKTMPRGIQILLGVVGLAIAYAFGTRAIDTGSLLQYAACALVFGLSIRLFVLALKKRT